MEAFDFVWPPQDVMKPSLVAVSASCIAPPRSLGQSISAIVAVVVESLGR